ncbi:MAG: fibronectin type III domain-containing protein [Thermoanaerobaculia bacterium]
MRQFTLAVLLLCAVSASAAIPSSERDALIAIYDSTNGPAWADRTNWLGAAGTECTWHGVGCDETQSNVIDIDLDGNQLSGTLPSSIRNFTKLQSLLVGSNNLHGPLPSQIGELSELEKLYGDAAQFTGPIPHSFSALKKLTYLGLRSNELSGPLPALLGDLTALEELYLENNKFTGAIPDDLAKLTNLKVLELTGNDLTGKIPASLASLTKLERLTLGDNELTGEIPPQLGNLTSLVTLRLGDNHLTGPIPPEIGQLHALEELYLPVNQLSGAIPAAIGGLSAIKRLDLRSNQFSGALPAELYQLTALEELQLSGNQFTGGISAQIANLANLQVLDLYNNHFSGPIPPELGNIAPLRSLELLSNEFTGPIPVELARLTNLTWIDIADNQLTGTIPPQLGTLAKLEVLSMYNNALEGTIPRELGQLANLRLLLLGQNQLHGTIPDDLRNLTKLEQFNVNGNTVTGPVPSWIGEWRALTDLFLSGNQFSGPLPPGLATLDNLAYLELADNQLTGRLPDFTRLTQLRYLVASYNHFSGPLPPSIGLLSLLEYVSLGSNDLSGPIPPEIGGLTSVMLLDLTRNDFDGPIPKEIANLKNAYSLQLAGNHLSGALPKELGQLTNLQFLGLSFNALVGEIPREIMGMTGLEDHRSNVGWNGLYANDAATRAFVNLKQDDGDFEWSQTVRPANVRVASTTDRSATLRWEPIRYTGADGGYQVTASLTPNGPPVALATSSSKFADTLTLRNLQPSTTYYFTVATVSHPVSDQENLITSERTAPLQVTTRQRVLAPPDVVMTDTPGGMVQIDRVEVQGDSFTLTNFGDVSTAITLGAGEDFFTISPAQFTLAGGASQVVTITSLPRDAGTYSGYVTIEGAGVPDDLNILVVLLSSTRPAGSVVATPLATRIELAGAPGSDEVGVAQFRNTGTARLTGIVLSDQPWVEVSTDPITIEPGAVGSVNFRIVRAKRPAGAEGALTANLSLVYVSGAADARTISTEANTVPGINITKVTIVDVTQPSVAIGSIPALLPGEVPFFIPGLTNTASMRSDVSLVNATGAQSIDDLRLYFTGGAQTSVASLQPLPFSQSINLVNILGSVYGAQGSGAVQVRTTDAANINAGAKVTAVMDEGTYTGAVPVFRGDRTATPGETLYLAGLMPGGDLFVQETGGTSGRVDIAFLNAAGTLLSTRSEDIGGYGLVELTNAIPANAVTAALTTVGSSISAYARLHDTTGDTWSVVDWSQFYDYARTETVRVPIADGRTGSARRRGVRHLSTDATNARRATDVVLFNPSTAEVQVSMQVIDTTGRIYERTTNVAARATVTVRDVASIAGTSIAHVVIEPERGGQVVVTARTHDADSGSAIPVVSATAGLRLGQSQVFSGLDDTASLRTGYGFVETGGATTKVRARIIISETNSLVSTITDRTFTLAPREQLFLPELIRSFAGNRRDSLGDFSELVLELEVIEGTGAIVPFVMTTDVGTEDVSIQVH